MYRGVLSRLILANIFATPEGRIYPAQALFDVLSIRPDVNNFWQYPTNSKQDCCSGQKMKRLGGCRNPAKGKNSLFLCVAALSLVLG
jgi:hypothetical protein